MDESEMMELLNQYASLLLLTMKVLKPIAEDPELDSNVIAAKVSALLDTIEQSLNETKGNL